MESEKSVSEVNDEDEDDDEDGSGEVSCKLYPFYVITDIFGYFGPYGIPFFICRKMMMSRKIQGG